MTTQDWRTDRLHVKQGYVRDEFGETRQNHPCGHYMDNRDTPLCINCGGKMKESAMEHAEGFINGLKFFWWCSEYDCSQRRHKYFRQVEPALKGNIDIDEVIIRLGVPKKYTGFSKDKLKLIDNKGFGIESKIQDKIKAWIDKNECNLYLWGGVGSGKTHVVVALMRGLILKGKTNQFFKNVPDLLSDIRNSFREGAAENDSDIINRYSQFQYLVLDDLGAEKESEYSMTALYMILNHRYENNKITIITSNMAIVEIGDKIGERISSRIDAFGKGVWHLTGKDWRRK